MINIVRSSCHAGRALAKTTGRALAAAIAFGTIVSVVRAAPPEPFEITSGVLLGSAAACEALQGGVDGGSEASFALDTGICLYHLQRAGDDKETLLRAVSALRNAQTWGLDRSRHATANLVEGLASCRLAQLELQTNLSPDKAQTPLFCVARKGAQASFSRVKLPELRVSYAQDTSGSVESLITGMSACYNEVDGPLNSKFAEGCGVFTGLDSTAVAAVATQAYQQVYNRYLNGASAPVTAMFDRKRQIAEQGVSGTRGAIEGLERDSTRIRDSWTVEQAAYDATARELTDLVQAYQSTLATSSAVLKSYNSWKDGLFEQKSPTVINYLPQLQARVAAVDTLIRGEFGTEPNGALTVVRSALSALGQRATLETRIQADARAICRAYYCEAAVTNTGSSFTRTCDRLQSPLCPRWNTKLAAGSDEFTAEEFCNAAGLAQEFRRVLMSRTDSNRCWTGAQ